MRAVLLIISILLVQLPLTGVDWISGEDERDDIVFLNPKDGKRTADQNGVSTIYVIGAPQKEDLFRCVGVQIKRTKINDAEAALSNLMEVVGIRKVTITWSLRRCKD